MLLTPRYDGPPVLVFDGAADDPSVPLLRQRRRLADVLGGLDDDQWASPSRCEGWSAKDVVAHLVGTNQFWAASIAAGRAGSPTRFLATFDPVATPPLMVDAVRSQSPAEVLTGFVESADALAEAVADMSEDEWSTLAEAPPGHVPIRGVALHALWDSWIHERDVLLPLGLVPVEEPDEVRPCLRYAAAVGPALRATGGEARTGTLAVEATEPDVRFVVEVGATVVVRDGAPAGEAAHLRGRAVDLIEGLTFRAPLEHDLGPDERWLLGGLDEVFDLA